MPYSIRRVQPLNAAAASYLVDRATYRSALVPSAVDSTKGTFPGGLDMAEVSIRELRNRSGEVVDARPRTSAP
jgi:hypothetical protein